MITTVLMSLLLSVQVPDGFRVEVFARLAHPRALLALEDGTVLVSRPAMNDVLALRDTDGDGIADDVRTAVASVPHAHGLAMRGRTLYVAGVNRIVAADRLPDGSFGSPREIVANLPDGGRHPQRAIGFGGDGKLYVAIGSSCTDCLETHPEHATLLQLDADGSNRRIFARGLGETGGIDWHPRSGELWGAGGGELNRIGDGLNFGWPFCNGRKPAANAPALEGLSKEKFCTASEASALQLNAGMGSFAFYRGAQFPEAWRDDGFSAGGSGVARIRFENDRPVAAEAFVTGAKDVAGIASSSDGAMLFTDATDGVVYRVAYGPSMRSMASAGAELIANPVARQLFRVGDLRAPDSVVHDEEQDVYFVSNVDGPAVARDGNGFIARITPDGKMATRKFIDGLNAPKGMAIAGATLWIADIDLLRGFDRVTGDARATIDLAQHGAVFLDGVAVGPDQAIYVTDTDVVMRGDKERVHQGGGRIFRVDADGGVEVAMHGEELRSPSGIVWDGTRFLIAQSYGNEVLAWNRGMGTKAVLRGPGAYDGIVVLPNGAVIVSSHYDDALHVGRPLASTVELRLLFSRKPSPGDLGFDRKRNRLLIPSSDGDWLEAWTLPPLDPPAPQTTAKEGRVEMASTSH